MDNIDLINIGHKVWRNFLKNEKVENAVFLFGIPRGVTEKELMKIMLTYGTLTFCHMNYSEGCAVSAFTSSESSTKFHASEVKIREKLIRTVPCTEADKMGFVDPETEADSEDVIVVLGKRCCSDTVEMDEQVAVVVDFIKLKDPARNEKILLICRDLEEHLSALIPGCIAKTFGSTITGLTLQGSDVDIVLYCDSSGEYTRDVSAEILVKSGRKVMFSKKDTFANVIGIPNAKTPIIKFVHVSTRISCDLSFHNISALKNSELLKRVLDLDTRLCPLIIFLKYWGKFNYLIGPSRFSSYSWTLMVLFCMQQLADPIVPPLISIMQHLPQKNTNNDDGLHKLVQSFFRLYTQTSLDNYVICPLLGKLLSRDFLSGDMQNFPKEMDQYRETLANGDSAINLQCVLAVQDPLQLNFNVTGGVKNKHFSEFLRCCSNALETLNGGLLKRLFDRRIQSKYVPPKQEVTTTLRGAKFLSPEYLMINKTENEFDTLSRKELYRLWLNIVSELLPQFLNKIVRYALIIDICLK